MSEYRELLLGCGYSREKRIGLPNQPLKWQSLTTVDSDPACKPDFVIDLDTSADWPLPSNFWTEIHAYEVLEHLGHQGDAVSFFHTFSEIYRLLRPCGYLFASCPSRFSPWLWGDPSHRRAIQQESLVFLDRAQINANRQRKTSISNFDELWRGDFKVVVSDDNHAAHIFCLQAMKPIRTFGESK